MYKYFKQHIFEAAFSNVFLFKLAFRSPARGIVQYNIFNLWCRMTLDISSLQWRLVTWKVGGAANKDTSNRQT